MFTLRRQGNAIVIEKEWEPNPECSEVKQVQGEKEAVHFLAINFRRKNNPSNIFFRSQTRPIWLA